eukprot:12881071-Ditylum_brightwellii.AAC.1
MITKMSNVLSNHCFESRRSWQGNNQCNNNNSNNTNKETDESPMLSFAQMEGKCYCCGKTGHKSPQCSRKNTIAQNDLAINKSQLMQQQAKTSNGNSYVSSITDSSQAGTQNNRLNENAVGWAGLQYQFT